MLAIDTNVFAIAEGLNPDASENCIAACVALLRLIETGYPVVVDEGDAIFAEYLNTLGNGGTSGFAVKLVRTLYHTRFGNPGCVRVPITPAAAPPGEYDEVPATLRDFDADDQKFIAVAVAVAADGGAPIAVGLDGDWWDRQADFVGAGVDIQFLCFADLVARAHAP
jgi:hypothetical protein